MRVGGMLELTCQPEINTINDVSINFILNIDLTGC